MVKSMKIKCHRNYKFRPFWRSTNFYCLKNSLSYNILFKPKERESIFMDKIWQEYRKQYVYDWSDEVKMHLIRSYTHSTWMVSNNMSK